MFIQLTDAQVKSANSWHAENLAQMLAKLSYVHVTQERENVDNATVNFFEFIAPCKMKLVGAKCVVQTVGTGTGNEPVASLRNATADKSLATITKVLTGSPAVGDTSDMALTTTEADLTIAKGDKIIMRLVTADVTVTVAWKLFMQFEWHAVAA